MDRPKGKAKTWCADEWGPQIQSRLKLEGVLTKEQRTELKRVQEQLRRKWKGLSDCRASDL